MTATGTDGQQVDSSYTNSPLTRADSCTQLRIVDEREAQEMPRQETKQPVESNGFNDDSNDVESKKAKEARPGLEPGHNGFAIRPLSHLGTAPVGSNLRR